MEFRVFEKPKVKTPFVFGSSAEVYEKMKDYNKADRELMLILFLDSKNHVMKIETHSIGTVDSSAVYPREVFKSAILNNASSFICIHNHPSGDPDPSEGDREITKHIVFCSELLQIKALDHIILGDNKYFSFADQGLMNEYEILAKQKLNN